ncbi:hypothetical protein GCM10020256_59500 [Streptomyces thermocoprophilus]
MNEHDTRPADRDPAQHETGGRDTRRHDNGAQVSTGIETAGVPDAAIPELVIISGMSGAGRSTAAKCLEDLGWFVVDNLPPALIPTMVELGARSQGNVARIAVVVDVRGRRFFDNLRESLADLDHKGVTRRIVFLESSDEALVRRFESVRRPHPSRATAVSSTASPPSGNCCASCAATPTWSSTPPASMCTSCAPRWTPSSRARRSPSCGPR